MQSETPAARDRTSERLALRWRWYHYYFLLALIDVVVIGATLTLYHRTLGSYHDSLEAVGEIEKVQGWLAELRAVVVELNAPGNDIFGSGELDFEYARFSDARERLEGLLELEEEHGTDISPLRRQMASMIAAEQHVFEVFHSLEGGAHDASASRALLDEAAVTMARMDRSQADALHNLRELEGDLRQRELNLLHSYGANLTGSYRFERYFVVAMMAILGGMFWYGRKLQRTHEEMIAERQRFIEERQSRLAAVGEVCASVAHAIRNPLSGIRTTAEVALEEVSDGSIAEALEDVVSEVDRLEERVRKLLNFSRPFEPQFEELDVGGLVKTVADGVKPRALRAGVKVALQRPEQPVWVRADPNLLVETIYELADNGLRSMAHGGTLKLTLEERGPVASLRVADEGRGIPEPAQQHVFQLFFTTRSDGTGMGLANVKRAVDLHDGFVSVESSGPGGTVFRVDLPLVRRSRLLPPLAEASA